MHLSAIDIFGFKSFPHRTRIEFGPGISAVVGPNGCGKSNVADAFRWALGEQSAKALRGDVMEDLIFNGTAETPPLSVAEVSISFADVNGYLPVDADELVVTRRMYRSGESHYFLNERPVRLKDVRDLFSDTGLGKASYAVVEQGMVEAIVNAKAEERRAFFEEAAGIRGYRGKRAEAMRKLDDVRANMERLDDLYAEYKRRARALKRQAGAARRYQGLVDRLRDLEVAFAKRKYRAKVDEKRAALADRDRCAAAAREAKGRAANAAAEVSRLDAEVARLELALERGEKELLERQRGLNEAQAAKQLAEERARALEGEVGRLSEERARLAEDLERAGDEDRKISGELERSRREVAAREEQRDRAERDLASARSREAELLEGLKAARGEQLRKLHDRTRLANLHATAAAACKSLYQELSRLRDEAARQASLFDDNLVSLDNLSAELASVEGELNECRDAAEELAAYELRLSRELAAAGEAASEMGASLAEVQSRLASLKDLAARLESFGTGVASLLEGGRPAGVVGLLADAVDVREGYEAALERALAYAVGAVFVEDLRTATAYGRRLKASGAGRAAFVLPCDGRPAAGDLPVVEGVRGWASDFVAVAGPYIGAVNRLLRDVVVVEDLGALEAVAEVCPGTRAVTLGGDWWDGEALLLAGAAEEVGATIFGRRAEIEKLAAALEGLERGLEGKRRDVRRLTAAREDLARRKQEGAARLARLEAASANGEAALARAREEGRALADRRDVLAAEVGGAEAGLAAAFSEEERLGSQLEATEHACEEKAGEVEEVEEQLRAVRALVVEGEEAGAAARENVAALREKLRALAGERERLARLKAEGTARREALASALEKKAEEARELAEEAKECGAEIAERAAVFKTAEGGVKEGRLKRADLIGRRREAEEARAVAEANVAEVADALKEEEVEVASLVGELNALEEAVGAKYGVRLGALGPEEYELDGDLAGAEVEREELARRLGKMGEVNFLAAREYDALAATVAELEVQRADLAQARADLDESIARIDAQSREKFVANFELVRGEFRRIFQEAFGGGQADLRLQPGVDPLEAGIYIYAQPPGKKMERLSLLSGGEKALAAIALIFALFNVRPAPFAILDEVDAPLDERNIGRFLKLLSAYRDRVQFMIVTHARPTMEAADVIYGVTMERRGVSKVLSLKLDEVPQEFMEAAAAAPAN
ncbi:MAG: chromosome segregation protein SMC [candidate division Zixibacteria bacterium]|nr:chromosome segregation protein SMC [candidate division Zixibacteria bacterium]